MADVMGPMGLRCFSSESQSAKMEGKSWRESGYRQFCHCGTMAKDIASFPRADTDIIKSEDMMTALPVPRSSSEVIKPSELFLDLMMLDPLKTKAVSETKPSTAPRTNEASTKEITPIAACSTFSAAQAVQQSPPAAKESQSSLAQQMVANATAAAASMPFCQAAPCHSIPDGPRTCTDSVQCLHGS
eukprot:symbB.v1.2.004104.t1/scaffold231.1/size297012/7